MNLRIEGLVAATYTPMHEDGRINPAAIPAMVDHLESNGVQGLFVCGSTGEGLSLTTAERKSVAEAYCDAARNRLKTIIHVGHHSLREAQELAAHAGAIGADAISSVAPSYFPVNDEKTLLKCIAEVANSAPDLPYFYYHIPALTGIPVDMLKICAAAGQIPNFSGIKFTSFHADEFLLCEREFGDRYQMVWGYDEMMLPGLAVGAEACIGSTFNFAAPLYNRLIEYYQEGNMEEARELQSLSIKMINAINGGPFHPTVKRILTEMGVPTGPARAPMETIEEETFAQIWQNLQELKIFDF